MKPAAIIAVLALALTAPSTALAKVYFGTVRYAAPHAAPAPGSGRAVTSEAPYLAYVSVAYNSHGGTLVMKYAFYQPSLWNGRPLGGLTSACIKIPPTCAVCLFHDHS